jgi:uncharacterized DUF497 family protein
MASILEECEGFDWDDGNSKKNWYLHGVTDEECEEVFSNIPIIVAFDQGHSANEIRHTAIGRTNSGRRIFIAFTVRNLLFRVISAREMNRREERRYEEEIKRNTEF